jgi:hypothetical protein|tara:strand:+ start:181 stop:543 length:363 start_codon:yes stop_codon:yes gene_type:complete
MNNKITTKTRVRLILEGSEQARNESQVCVCTFWSQELQELGYQTNSISVETLFSLIMQKKLTSSETIRRTKCKIQEQIVELRGSTYEHRKEILEPHIRDIYRKTAREKHEEEIQRRMLEM